MKILIPLLIIITLLNVFDIYSTHYIISNNLGHEGNPIMASLMDKYGVLPALFWFKGIVIITLFILAYLVRNKISSQRFYIVGAWIVILTYAYFMLEYNFKIMFM
jgi:hypothetical protein